MNFLWLTALHQFDISRLALLLDIYILRMHDPFKGQTFVPVWLRWVSRHSSQCSTSGADFRHMMLNVGTILSSQSWIGKVWMDGCLFNWFHPCLCVWGGGGEGRADMAACKKCLAQQYDTLCSSPYIYTYLALPYTHLANHPRTLSSSLHT